MKKIMTYDPRKNKYVIAGYIDKTTFVKTVTTRHFFRKLQSYAIQEDVIQELIEKNIKKIKIMSNTVIFESSIKDWVNGHSLLRDYGKGLQRFLPIYYMKKIKRKR